jgi:hypothetical protein
MGYSRHIIDVLVDEGYEWVIVPATTSAAPARPTTPRPIRRLLQHLLQPAQQGRPARPSPTDGWWYGEPNPGNAAWNVAPFAYQLHKVKYVNPDTGADQSMVAVPSDDVLSYRFGYANEGIGKIQTYISPFATDPPGRSS